VKRFVRKLRGPQCPEAAGIILTAAGEEAQVDYGSGPMVRDPQSAKYRRTRLFVLTLGYSRKSVRLLAWRSSARIWAELHVAGLRHEELRALEGPTIKAIRSTSAGRSGRLSSIDRRRGQAPQAVPVIRQLAEILNEYRISMGNPKNGVVFHSRTGEHLDFDRLGQRVVRPAVESLRLDWHGWHGFRRGIASNSYELGANDKIVQRILRQAKPHVTRERYIRAFDPAVLAAMKQMGAALDVVSKRLPTAYQVN
jgi:hypothetical protein